MSKASHTSHTSHTRRLLPQRLLMTVALVLLSVTALYGCSDYIAGTDLSNHPPITQPTATISSPSLPGLPKPQPTYPPIPHPIGTAPQIPTPVPTSPPTEPPPQPTPTELPPQPLPTLTVGPPILLTRPIPNPNQPGVQWFSSTGHTLRGDFLNYWNAHGGQDQFGLPLTEEFVEARGPERKPVRVQYLKRAIFESDPEINAGKVTIQSGGEAFGAQKLKEKGYDAGAFPRYGHALDFSWLSGEMLQHMPSTCMIPGCGCSIVLYEGPNLRVQLDGETWRTLADGYNASFGRYLTVFGRIVAPGVVDNHCSWEKDTMQVYIVEDVQANRVP